MRISPRARCRSRLAVIEFKAGKLPEGPRRRSNRGASHRERRPREGIPRAHNRGLVKMPSQRHFAIVVPNQDAKTRRRKSFSYRYFRANESLCGEGQTGILHDPGSATSGTLHDYAVP